MQIITMSRKCCLRQPQQTTLYLSRRFWRQELAVQYYGNVGKVYLFVLGLTLQAPPYTNSPYWSPYILLSTSWENLFKHQDNW